jgi:UDP-N-acetylmuramate--alanine ligase
LLFEDFCLSFAAADELLVTEIYPAGEKTIQGVSGEALSRKIKKRGGKPHVQFCADLEVMKSRVLGDVRKGDIVITLGAGSIGALGSELARYFSE